MHLDIRDVRAEVQSNLRTYSEERTKLLDSFADLEIEVVEISRSYKGKIYKPTKNLFGSAILDQCSEIIREMTSWRRHEKQVQSDLKEEMAKAKDFDAGAKKVVAEDILDATRRLLSDELATLRRLLGDLQRSASSLRSVIKGESERQ